MGLFVRKKQHKLSTQLISYNKNPTIQRMRTKLNDSFIIITTDKCNNYECEIYRLNIISHISVHKMHLNFK